MNRLCNRVTQPVRNRVTQPVCNRVTNAFVTLPPTRPDPTRPGKTSLVTNPKIGTDATRDAATALGLATR